jgi:hypothetical protein
VSLPQILHLLKLLLAAVVTGCGTVLAAALQGAIVLPPTVTAVLTSIVSIGAGLGIASGGVEKPSGAPPSPAPPPGGP